MKKGSKKRAFAWLLALSLSAGNLTGYSMPVYAEAGGTINDYAAYVSDETVADFRFGTDITKASVYDSAKGYGFSDVSYPNAAEGWISNVYNPRKAVVTESSSGFVSDAAGALAIGSKVWTETESTGYGVYTYENTSTFDMGLSNADYEVTVTFVNPTSAAYTAYVETEDITKASGIVVAPGASVESKVTACLLDGKLNVKFLAAGSATSESAAAMGTVYVSGLKVVRKATNAAGTKPTVFIASDSTVQTYDASYYPQTGWGQTLYNFFGAFTGESECEDCTYSQAQTYETENVIIENRAIGGRSSKSFIEEGKLDDLLEDVKPGDYLLVQWGHNDATYSRPNRYVSSADFATYIQYYIDGCRQRGATCVLVTPVARYSYNADGTFNSNFEAYRQVMLSMGAAQNVPVLDLTAASIELCESFGIEGSKSLFLQLAAGDYTGYYEKGVADATHLQYYGAYKFAQCVAQLIKDYAVDAQLDGLRTMVELNAPASAPAKIAGLNTTTVGASSVSLNWNPSEGAELYYIYRAELAAGQTAADVDFSAANKYSVSSLAKYTDSKCESGKTYVYAIKGFNEFGLSEESDKLAVTTKSSKYKYDFCQTASNPTMPGWNQVTCTQAYTAEAGYGWLKAPGNGRSRAGNTNAASSLMADDFCLGAGTFAVDLPNGDYEIKIYAGDLLAGTSTIKPSYTAEGVAIGTLSVKQSIATLTAKVRVTDGQLTLGVGGTNAYINGMEITPLLLAPSNLSYSELDFTDTNATFLINFNGIDEAVSYKVYQKGSTDTAYTAVKTIEAAKADELDSRAMIADIGETFEYYVTAVTGDGTESASSNIVKVTTLDENAAPPAAPENLHCISAAEADIQIGWDAVDGGAYYNIYRSAKAEGDKAFTGFVKAGTAKGTSFTDTYWDLDTNIHYYYKVEAVGKGGPGEKTAALETPVTETLSAQKAESLSDRALVAVDLAGDKGAEINVTTKDAEDNELTKGVYLSWRLFENDPEDVTFTVYRNDQVIASDMTVTNCVDEGGAAGDVYKVVGSSDAGLGLSVTATETWENYYAEFQLVKPEDQTMPDASICTYTANDMSVGDLDGDGKYELLVKWMPSNSQDNSKGGYTGTTIIDAYDINGATGAAELLWRIDLGVNIRSGAHYTQFQVWDFDGDGKAELMCKTADGSTTYQNAGGSLTETGHVGACSASALPVNVVSTANDYRISTGYVLSGPEYLTVFDGETGKILDTAAYVPERGSVSAWGDAYGNRVDRFLSAVAYTDGETPSAVFCRGYYSRMCLTSYKFVDTNADGKGDKLQVEWKFDTNDYPEEEYGLTEEQGNHAINVQDLDGDGKDEIIYGGVVVDHDGVLKYTTELGHGDAMHVSDWIPSNDGLEIFSVHEHSNAAYQVEVHDAETGKILAGYFTGIDTGRGVMADVNPYYEGGEFWSNAAWNGTDGGMYTGLSTLDNMMKISDSTPSINFSLFWDGDLLSELQDHTFNQAAYVPVSTNITNWNFETGESEILLESTEIFTSNGTKGNMGLVADVLGDWREEIIARTSADASKIRIYTSTIETDYSIPCLMEDHAYRLGVAWQNVGYNQPTNLSYLLSEGLVTAKLSVAATEGNLVELSFTKASDGTYGNEIEAYEIYRAEGDGDYSLIDSVAVDELTEAEAGYVYRDITAEPLTDYSYMVAPVVAGKTSYVSNAVNASTTEGIKSVGEAADAEDIIEDTVLAEGKSLADLFQKTVDIVNSADETVAMEIDWNTDTINLSEPGTYEVCGYIAGYYIPVKASITVKANEITGYEFDGYAKADGEGAEYTVIVEKPSKLLTLPEKAVFSFLNGNKEETQVVWDASALKITKKGTYTITGQTAALAESDGKFGTQAVSIQVIVQNDEPGSADGGNNNNNNNNGSVTRDAVLQILETAKKDGTAVISTGNAVKMTVEALKTAAAKNLAVIIDTPDYTWKFSSIKNTADELTTTALEVFGGEGDIISKHLGKTYKGIQVNFAYSGNLPGTAEVTIKNAAGKLPAGTKSVFVYYYNPATKLFELLDTKGTVNQNGSVTFQITHCSEYVLSAVQLDDSLVAGAANPATGDHAPIAPFAGAGIAALCAAALMAVRKK
ncbi:rhamnogalacturonan lyase family protein [Anaerobium acetethylicum]|uniref:Fibronectin type 3 domain-containing protein n=1 Tax=Anaerobium acetethylicum TaxID=1619234 RepID=A0A1D3TVS1_9FIRM|nr:Ig-like domain-containing protein [Anaerobium acetethylicum]SCP98236.1 fibronectin type 3 domain-containing protein [Anaerobium acetethylicum]